MRKAKYLILPPLIYLVLAIAAQAAINAWTYWPAPYKFVLPVAIAITAVIDFFVRLNNVGRITEATPPARPTPVVQKPDAKKSTAQNHPLDELKTLAIYLAVGALFFMGVCKLAEFFHNNTQEAIKNYHQVVVTNPFGIKSGGCDNKVESSKHLWLDSGKVYDVCTLKNGQHWKWYFDLEIEYRIKATGREPFMALTRNGYSGGEPTADRAGTLQVRTKHTHNHIEVHRLVSCTTK